MLEKLLENDPHFSARERRACAALRSTAESEVFPDFWPIKGERVGIFPPARIAIGCRERDHHLRPCRHLEIADARVLAGETGGHLCRSLEAKNLFQQLWDERWILAQPVLQSGLVSDELHGVTEKFGACVLPCAEQKRCEPDDFQRIR